MKKIMCTVAKEIITTWEEDTSIFLDLIFAESSTNIGLVGDGENLITIAQLLGKATILAIIWGGFVIWIHRRNHKF